MKSITKNKIFKLKPNKFSVIVSILVLLVVGLVVYELIHRNRIKTVVVNKQVIERRSKDLGFITRGLTGKAVDVNTGKIVTAARVFSINDKTVYLQIDLANAPKGTTLDYIRYKNGRYVDHGELSLAKNDIKNVLFNWSISNLLSSLTTGNWKVATYANGILAKRIVYSVENNKVGYVREENDVNPGSSDYYLSSTLAKASKVLSNE